MIFGRALSFTIAVALIFGGFEDRVQRIRLETIRHGSGPKLI
jgi:hypothetical protein